MNNGINNNGNGMGTPNVTSTPSVTPQPVNPTPQVNNVNPTPAPQVNNVNPAPQALSPQVNNVNQAPQPAAPSPSKVTMQDRMLKFLKGLFNFGNVKKFFKYQWGSIIEDTLPKDSKEVIDQESYNNIFYGGVLRIVANLLAILFAIGMVYVIDSLDPTRISGLRTLGLKNDVGVTAFLPIIISVIIFTYNSAIGFQPQKSIFHFGFVWLIFIDTIFSLISLISYIASLFIAPMYALLGFVSFLLGLLGNVHIMVGCIDFCKRVTKNYIVAHTVAPVQSAITTTRINVDDVSDHNNKTCPYCANQIPASSTTCSYCGNNL